jgi:hypothetical protein
MTVPDCPDGISPEDMRRVAAQDRISISDVAAWMRELAARGWSPERIKVAFGLARPDKDDWSSVPPGSWKSDEQIRQEMQDLDDIGAAMKAAFGDIEAARERNRPPPLTSDEAAAMKAAMAAAFGELPTREQILARDRDHHVSGRTHTMTDGWTGRQEELEALAEKNGYLFFPPTGDRWLLVDMATDGECWSTYDSLDEIAEEVAAAEACRYWVDVDTPGEIEEYLEGDD